MKFGIVGAGFIVEEFLKNIESRKSIEVVGIFSRTFEKTKVFAKNHEIQNVYETIEGLLDSDVDAVYIASHSNSHFDYSMKAIEKGKHVLCEKPITINSWELEILHKRAEEEKVILMEGMRTLYMSSYKRLKELIDNKHFGNIISIETSAGRISSRLYRHTKELAGGSLMDLGVYCIYVILDILGIPKKVKAEALKLDSGVDSTVLAMFKYDKSLASMYSSCVSKTRGELRVLCEEGVITLKELSTAKEVELLNKDGVLEIIHCPKESTGMIYEVLTFEDRVNKLRNGGGSEIITDNDRLSLSVMKIMDEIRGQIGVKFSVED